MNLINEAISAYAESHCSPQSHLLDNLCDATKREMALPAMLSGPMEGRFLKFLVAMAQPKFVLELGTFTGFSALSMAEALPAEGKVLTCEIDAENAKFAQKYFDCSPHGHKVEIKLGPALETIHNIEQPIDFVFIDADKTSYRQYFDSILPKLSDKGVIVIDNTLWSGTVLNPQDAEAEALANLNDYLKNHKDVECVLLPLRDGITLIRKKVI